MQQAQFDNYLLDNVPRAILLYGDNNFYIKYYSKILQKKINVEPTIIYFSDYIEESVLEILQTQSLFGDKNLIIAKLNAPIKKNHFKDICKALEQNKNSYFIVEFYKSGNDLEYASKYKEFASFFKHSTLEIFSIRFYESSHDDAIKFMNLKAKKLGMKIDIESMKYLFELQSNNLDLAINELEKLSVYENITKDLIDSICYGQGELRIDELIHALFIKNKNIFQILQKLDDEGVKDIEISGALNKYFMNLFKINAYSKINGRVDIKGALGFFPPKDIANFYMQRSLKLNEKNYIDIFDMLNRLRIGIIKSQKNMLESTLVKLQKIV